MYTYTYIKKTINKYEYSEADNISCYTIRVM